MIKYLSEIYQKNVLQLKVVEKIMGSKAWYKIKVIFRKNMHKLFILFITTVVLVIISSIWLSIKHNSFVTVLYSEYWIYFFNAMRLEVFIGSAISIAGIVISIMILDYIRIYSAQSIDDFLEILIKFFEKSQNGDKIVIISSTLFFGKTKKTNVLAKPYLELLEKKIHSKANLKFEIYTLKHDSSLLSEFNSGGDDDEKLDKIRNKSDELIDFHFTLYKAIANSNDIPAKRKYFKELLNLSSMIYDSNNIEVKDIPQKLKDLNAILFFNEERDNGIIGVFNQDSLNKISGNYIDEPGSVKTLIALYQTLIDGNGTIGVN